MLHEFVTANREEIIRRCRANVAVRSFPPPSDGEINHGVPVFLDQLVDALRSGEAGDQIDRTAAQHGHDLLLRGFTVSQVVHDYGDVCQTVTQLAVETNAPISTEDFRTLNRCLDEAIAGAVTIYATESHDRAAREHQEATGRSNERVSFLVHELRNLVNTALVAFEVLKSGSVGTSGSTGAVLNRSLIGLRDIITHSLDEVRMTKGVMSKTRIDVPEFIEHVAAAAGLVADARGVSLTIVPVEGGVAVEADSQVLTAVVANLIQNACKFTARNSLVTLRVRASADRVLVEVEDQCGGLPGAPEGMELPPTFEQRGSDRSGLGVGLTFSRWGAEANGGRLYARNLPQKGCVFTVDLPRATAVATATA